jgi:hydrogenase maturation factor HypE
LHVELTAHIKSKWAAKRHEESIVTIVNKASSAPSIAAKERRLEMDQAHTESLLETQLRVYREAQQRSLEQLQERQRRALAKAALNRQSIQYERRAILLQVCGRP